MFQMDRKEIGSNHIDQLLRVQWKGESFSVPVYKCTDKNAKNSVLMTSTHITLNG